jgi:hypothetical protein
VGITTIQHEELEEISNESIGNGVFGNCFPKKFIRLGITVVEKQLTDSTADMLYKEAIFLPKLSHICIPLLLGVQLDKKPISLIMQFIGENSQSITVFKLLFDSLYQHQASLQKCQPKHGSAYVMTSLMHLNTCTKEDISTVA